MVNKNEKDYWVIDYSHQHRGEEEPNSDAAKENIEQPKPGEAEKDAWELEVGLPPDYIGAPNITPETPKERWKPLFWRAVRASVQRSITEEDVLRKMKLWNTANNPQVPEKRLEEMVQWAINHLYPYLKKR